MKWSAVACSRSSFLRSSRRSKDTRLGKQQGVQESREMTTLQWQIMMKCWKMAVSSALRSWWGPIAWRSGALGLWLWKLRKLNGRNFTWPLLLFAGRAFLNR